MTRRAGHRWAIDGIENGMARIEEDGERMITLPAWLLPSGAREGQMLQVTTAPGEQGTLVITVAADEEATAESLARSKATMARAMARSKKRDAGGDVAL
jgi:hypothetical protein